MTGPRPTPCACSDQLTLAGIAEGIAEAHGVTVADIRGRSRAKPVNDARQAFMATAYRTGRWTEKTLGEWLGRSHATVWHGIRAHEARVEWLAKRKAAA